MKLETEIFLFPIELRTLIPDYYRTLNPDYVTDFQARIQKLAKKVDELDGLRWDVRSLIKQEYVFDVIDKQIEEGNGVIGGMRQYIAATFPKTHPESVEARKKMGEILNWFINLYEAWSALNEKE